MKALDFVRSLLPFFPRGRLQEEFRVANNDLTTLVIPTIENIAKEVKGNFKSKEAQNLAAVYKSYTKSRGENIFPDILEKSKKIKELLTALENEVSKGFEEKIVSTSMTYKKANIVRLIGVIGFYNKFTLSLINGILHFEAIASGLEMTYISDVTPGEIDRLKRYIADYSSFSKTLVEIKDPVAVLTELPEVLVEASDIAESFSANLDPFGVFGATGFRGSPVYFIAMNWADYQHRQYKKMEAQRQAAVKRVMAIKRAQAGNPSPELEQQIEILSSKIASLNEELRKYEESLA